MLDLRTLRASQHQLPPHDAKGRICALWLSPNASHLVIKTDLAQEVWARKVGGPEIVHKTQKKSRVTSSAEGEGEGAGGWIQVGSWESPPGSSSRFSGQHCMAAARTSFDWPAGLKSGQHLVALGHRNSVRLVALETGEEQAELMCADQTCNCVWLSPGCRWLATAGCSHRIMVWQLPELALIHNFPVHGRVWALCGDERILASAGADSQVTIRSLETGAVVMRLPRPGPVHVRIIQLVGVSHRV